MDKHNFEHNLTIEKIFLLLPNKSKRIVYKCWLNIGWWNLWCGLINKHIYNCAWALVGGHTQFRTWPSQFEFLKSIQYLISRTYLLHHNVLTRGAYFQKFNPPLFAGLSLPLTEIRPKHSEGVIWAQNKCHFWTQTPSKPLYRHFVWPYVWIWNVIFFYILELSA